MSNYRKTMSQALQEMYPINEDNIDLMRKAAGGAAQTVKMKDGKLKMDMFTASAIMQILDKVNPANKKKMTDMINKGTKDGMMKLQDFAMKQVKSENDPEIEEDVDLDEADDFKPHMMYDPKTGKGYKADTMDDHLRMKKMGYTHDAPKKEEVDLDEGFKTGDKVKIDTEFEGETHNGQSGVIHKVGTGRNKGAYTVKFSDGKVQSYDDEELITLDFIKIYIKK